MADAPKATEDPPEDPKGKQPAVESDNDSDSADDAPTQGQLAADSSSSKKKKDKKKKKKKKASISSNPIADLPPNQMAELLSKNPALANEFAAMSGGADPAKLAQFMKGLSLEDIMTGLTATGKGAKDMASYKFWQTQPVPKFGEDQEEQIEEGPFKVQTLDEVSKKPAGLIDGFEWVTMDLTNDDELKEVYELLNGHYVEDDEAMFRFKYSINILKWALMAPGWKQQWHTGVRASQSRKLVAFISAIPIELRIRDKTLHASEVNFLCVHKKLRGKRLSPVLIKEITRLCNLEEVWQAIYTAGVVLPKPVSTCRYFHRAINWQKLYEVGFSPLPPGSKPQYQIRKYSLPDHAATKGLRAMKAKDVDAVKELLQKYLTRFHLAPEFTREEVEHWLLDKNPETPEQVVFSYVVEKDGKITDFFSFYCLESSVINSSRHSVIRAAYLFYYATEIGLGDNVDKDALGKRLNQLISDALILSKGKFDVFNALSLMDNSLFLEQQKFGPGDGQLHYYLFNYKANPISGGIDRKNQLDKDGLSGIGVVML